MSTNSITWFEIYVQDMARARGFYEAVLQKSLQPLSAPDSPAEMWQFMGDMNTYGANGALVKMAGMPSGGNSVLIYFSCEDCAIETGRVVANGGRIQRAKMSIGQYGFISLVYDTEGNMLGLHSMK